MSKTLHTKYGKAKVNNNGYYRITSKKEGNHNKLLHRLIWEDFYNCKVPDGYVIHHRNHIKTDNCILNLQLMRDKDHRILHSTGNKYCVGRKLSEETKNKISEAHTGKNLSEEHKLKLSEAHTGKTLSDETKKKMSEAKKGKNSYWYGKTLPEETKKKMSETHNTSGYYRVSKSICKNCKQGFYWQYSYYENGKQKFITSVSLEKLEVKVKAKGLVWIKF